MSTCRTCHAEIDFYPTSTGRGHMPVDREATADGNVVIRDGRAIVTAYPADGEQRRTPHWATCAQAAEHRRRP